MVSINRILCPIDFSDFSLDALRHGLALAHWYSAHLTLFHVYHVSQPLPVEGLPGSVPAFVELDPNKLVQVIASSSGNSAVFKAFSERALSGKFSPPSFALNLAHKDLHLAMELADELDVPLPQGSATHNLQRMARKMGLGDNDSSTILQVYETVLKKTVKP